VILEAAFDRFGNAGEVPELPFGPGIERSPDWLRGIGGLEVGEKCVDVVENVGRLDEHGVSRHANDVLELLPLANEPAIGLVDLPPFVLRDLEDQGQDLVAEIYANALAPIGVRHVFQVVVENGCSEHLVADSEAREDTHGPHKMGDVWHPVREEIATWAVAILAGSELAELVVVAAGGEPHRGLEQRGEQSTVIGVARTGRHGVFILSGELVLNEELGIMN
jgi:hypothetical protein